MEPVKPAFEAIAWVLFNYQGDYAKEDLIRNGSGSAQVTVAFTSNYDSRTYEVQRCTQKGYVIFDPQLNERLPYSRVKDEVLPWLRQHLGVSQTTNLPQLFSRTVGVPQGTFTADFLQPAEHRKAVFDSILKVEDYKLAFKQMNTLRRYAEDQVEAVKGQLQQYEEALTAWDELTQRQQALAEAIQAHERQLAQRQQELQTLAAQRETTKAQAQRIQTLAAQRQSLTHQIEAKQLGLTRLQQSAQQAQQAVEICQANRAAFEGYQVAEQALQQLTQRQQERQTRQEQYQKLQKTHGQKQAELVRWQTQLESFAATERELAALQPQLKQQEELEAQQQGLQKQLDQLQQLQMQQQTWQTQLEQLERQQAQVAERRESLLRLQPEVEKIAGLEEQRDRLQQQLSRLAAARQFEGHLQSLVNTSRHQQEAQQADTQTLLKDVEALLASLPLAAENTLQRLQNALQQSADWPSTLITELEIILRDLADQTDEVSLKKSLKGLETELKQCYNWRAELNQLSAVESQAQTLEQDHRGLTAQVLALAEQLDQQQSVEAAIASLNQQIEALGYPRQKTQILKRTLQDKAKVETTHAKLWAQQAELDQQLATLVTQLNEFQTLDQQIAAQQAKRKQYQDGYGLYLQHRQLANQQGQLQTELATTQAGLDELNTQRTDAENAYQKAADAYDAEAAEDLEIRYNTLKSEADQLSGSLPQQRQRLADLDQQMAGLTTIAQRRDQAQRQLQAKEQIKRFVNFARKAYNEAGPRITEQYVRSVSVQADRLFRDLLNRPNVALQWTRDYEILVQDGANQRRFVNLSGGEQMCAALAIRLALLKVLADIDIAFFDEPTTNMDRPRRAGLAEAISRIKSFEQLFVISHDDTFESVTENVIIVEREG
ncbi:MAG: SMC family ATPase [Leptolyngbyaceae cyanobacterium SM2_5_2]|nr:SMC family ATPase [Leptolyngbyaceae cyanobacterium SM2_5_2]